MLGFLHILKQHAQSSIKRDSLYLKSLDGGVYSRLYKSKITRARVKGLSIK